jgi:hypothetical protein
MIFSHLPCHLLGKPLKYVITTLCKIKADDHHYGVLSEISGGGEDAERMPVSVMLILIPDSIKGKTV